MVLVATGDGGAELTGSSSISSMLRTGERGAYGDEARMRSGDAGFCGLFSSKASTSCRSMSRAASMLMGRCSLLRDIFAMECAGHCEVLQQSSNGEVWAELGDSR